MFPDSKSQRARTRLLPFKINTCWPEICQLENRVSSGLISLLLTSNQRQEFSTLSASRQMKQGTQIPCSIPESLVYHVHKCLQLSSRVQSEQVWHSVQVFWKFKVQSEQELIHNVTGAARQRYISRVWQWQWPTCSSCEGMCTIKFEGFKSLRGVCIHREHWQSNRKLRINRQRAIKKFKDFLNPQSIYIKA